MKLPLFTTFFLTIVLFCGSVTAQIRKSPLVKPRPSAAKSGEIGQTAIVIDETLSVLRVNPSLFSESIQRMHRGRKVQILAVTEADGVKFYKVTAPPSNFGWVQADAVFGKFRAGDEERFVKVVQALDGFD
ncbi:MAG: SH3 domain-containing protein, partial [Acidobacteriota bacterium]